MAAKLMAGKWLRKLDPFPKIQSYSWLYAPDKEAIFFALRTTIAAFMALTIALWMEMDSPKWSIITVSVIAQNTRGETMTKSKWRALGTIVGAMMAVVIIASFPQQPLLFELTMALWVGICCFIASLVNSSASYSVVLAGYTCAIISFAATDDPNKIFMLAMSRATYIILAVICQDLVDRIFAYNQHDQAHTILTNSVLNAITSALSIVRSILKGDQYSIFQLRNVFSSINTYRKSIEFRKAELFANNRTTDHVQAALFSVLLILVKLVDLAIYIEEFKEDDPTFKRISLQTQEYLQLLVNALKHKEDFNKPIQLLNKLRWECRQIIADYIYTDTDKAHTSIKGKEASSIKKRILYRSLSQLLGELEETLRQYQQSKHPRHDDKFTFWTPTFLNYKLAWSNGFRVFTAILVACFIWEITAWPDFNGGISTLCLAVARLCLFENSYKFSIDFLKGTLLAIIVGAILSVTLFNHVNSIEMLYVIMFIPMFLGGLSVYHLPARGAGLCYTTFLPFMLIADNQHRIDEITFLNNAFTVISGVAIGIFSFRYIAPYSPEKVRKEIRKGMLRNIHTLPTTLTLPNARRYLAITTDRFVSLMRQCGTLQDPEIVQRYNRGALAVMTIGLNVIEIRRMLEQDILSENIKQELRVVMRRIGAFKGGQYSRTVLILKSAIRRLINKEKQEKNIARRLQISISIACLIPISHVLERNMMFLNLANSIYE